MWKNSKNYISNNCIDFDTEQGTFREADWRQQKPLLKLARNSERQYTEEGKSVRNLLTEYFNNEGRVSFQDRMMEVLGSRNTE